MSILTFAVGQPVIVNTGGDDSKGTIVDTYRKYEHGEMIEYPRNHYWQNNFLVRFENGTQQYIPEECIRKEIFMTTEQIKLLEITVAKGIQEFKDKGLVASHVFISRAYPIEAKTIFGMEVIRTWLLEPDKIIITTKEFFEHENPWKYDYSINLEEP